MNEAAESQATRATIERPQEGPGLRWYQSLAFRVFLLAASIVTAVLAVTLALTLVQANRIGARTARDALARTAGIQETLHEERLAQLDLMAAVFVSDPALGAYLAQAQEQGDAVSILDLLEERRDELGYDFAGVATPSGRIVARTDRGTDLHEDLSDDPLFRVATQQLGAYGVWQDDSSPGGSHRLFAVAIAPIAPAFIVEGYLIIGFSLDQVDALEVRRLTEADVAYIVQGPDRTTIAGSTLDPTAEVELLEALNRIEGVGDRTAVQLEIGARRWLAQLTPLLEYEAAVDSGDVIARGRPAVVSLVSLDVQQEPFRDLARLYLGGGLLAMLLTASLLYWLTHRELRPLSRLSEATRAAARGSYQARFRSTRSDEVGQLARSFDHLLADLRERRDTETYLSQLARSVPEIESRRAFERSAVAAGSSGQAETLVEGAAHVGAIAPVDGGKPRIGERFDRLGTLGQGGMGVVYKAWDRTLGEVVALKTLHPHRADAVFLEQLKEELKLARRVTHPNVLRTHDFGELDGVAFITMELVPGISLRELLAQGGRPPFGAGLRISRDLCRGLEAAHAQGILHRDVKPENVLIEPSGNAKLSDFGLAGRPAGLADRRIVGTPDFMAPELFSGEPATRASDIYSVGWVLVEIFVGRRPELPGQDALARARYRQDHPVPALCDLWPEAPTELCEIVDRCLQRDPDARFQSVSELLFRLEPLHA